MSFSSFDSRVSLIFCKVSSELRNKFFDSSSATSTPRKTLRSSLTLSRVAHTSNAASTVCFVKFGVSSSGLAGVGLVADAAAVIGSISFRSTLNRFARAFTEGTRRAFAPDSIVVATTFVKNVFAEANKEPAEEPTPVLVIAFAFSLALASVSTSARAFAAASDFVVISACKRETSAFRSSVSRRAWESTGFVLVAGFDGAFVAGASPAASDASSRIVSAASRFLFSDSTIAVSLASSVTDVSSLCRRESRACVSEACVLWSSAATAFAFSFDFFKTSANFSASPRSVSINSICSFSIALEARSAETAASAAAAIATASATPRPARSASARVVRDAPAARARAAADSEEIIARVASSLASSASRRARTATVASFRERKTAACAASTASWSSASRSRASCFSKTACVDAAERACLDAASVRSIASSAIPTATAFATPRPAKSASARVARDALSARARAAASSAFARRCLSTSVSSRNFESSAFCVSAFDKESLSIASRLDSACLVISRASNAAVSAVFNDSRAFSRSRSSAAASPAAAPTATSASSISFASVLVTSLPVSVCSSFDFVASNNSRRFDNGTGTDAASAFDVFALASAAPENPAKKSTVHRVSLVCFCASTALGTGIDFISNSSASSVASLRASAAASRRDSSFAAEVSALESFKTCVAFSLVAKTLAFASLAPAASAKALRSALTAFALANSASFLAA
mmetsp:Transcript_8536/g.31938  ORF Transcript_8536/g.31938 Transcript_8536/m.31938 type:complete len:706 (-) Transcript_8536:3832-5949(-)